MIITIDGSKDNMINVQNVDTDVDFELLKRIRDARDNKIDNLAFEAFDKGKLQTLKKVIGYLKSIDTEDGRWTVNIFGKHVIEQIKMVRSVTEMGLKDAKDFVESC